MDVKQLWMVTLVLCLALAGCGAETTMETISDELQVGVMAQPKQILVELPDNAVAPVLESDSQQLYFSEEYQIAVETLSGGDVSATVKALSGCDREKLTLMKTKQGENIRYDFVWAAAGEEGDLMGRAAILDDGNYHYCLSVLRPATGETSQIIWQNVFDSFALAEGTADTPGTTVGF